VLGTFDQVLQVRAQGQEVAAFRLISQCHCLGLATKAGSGIESVDKLKGRTVGVAAAGGPMQNFVIYLLHQRGLTAEDVAFASIGTGPSAVAAVEHDSVDAAVLFYGADAELRKKGIATRMLAETFTPAGSRAAIGSESFPSTSLLARESWLKANREPAVKLSRAFGETIAWMRTHTVEEVRLRLAPEGRPSDPDIDRETLKLLIPALSETGRIDAAMARLSFNILAVSRAEVRGIESELERAFVNGYL
jgi:NitT/TauT family transport system substrate-binding protein